MPERVRVNGVAKVGDRVAYEDMANPYREGVVTQVVGSEYHVSFGAVPSKFGPEFLLAARETVSDLRQHGWTFVEAVA